MLAAARAGSGAAGAGGADAGRAPLRPARARARPAADPVRQVRRHPLPRSRARQGLRLRCSGSPTTPPTGSSWFRVLQLLDGRRPGHRPARARRPRRRPRSPTSAELPARWQTVASRCCSSPARTAAPAGRGARRCRGERAAQGGRRAAARRARAARSAPTTPTAPSGCRPRPARRRRRAGERASARFLAELALDPPSSSADYARPPHLDEDYLILSTVHSAKGLEWDAVHVIAASDGNFPSDMALTNPEGLEEERRLFYVALTRARRTLAIYVPLRYYHRPSGRDDAHGYGKPSRFLTDAGARHSASAYRRRTHPAGRHDPTSRRRPSRSTSTNSGDKQ